MSTSAPGEPATESAAHWRVAPSVPVAIGVFIAYVVVFIGLSSTSGINYDEWFDDGGNAFRSAVIPLIGGSLVLIAFVLWARWDWVFKDPERLPVSGFLRVPILLFGVGIIVHFAVADWGKASAGLLLAILAAGILVGFAEETLFRGIILRALRTNVRPEAWVILISSLWFGFFHMTNIANGSPVGGVISQCLIASAVGVVLYLFRRVRGLLVTGMIAHGLWDISVFVPAPSGTLATADLAVQIVVVLSALVAAIMLLRRERTIAMTRTGLRTV